MSPCCQLITAGGGAGTQIPTCTAWHFHIPGGVGDCECCVEAAERRHEAYRITRCGHSPAGGCPAAGQRTVRLEKEA